MAGGEEIGGEPDDCDEVGDSATASWSSEHSPPCDSVSEVSGIGKPVSACSHMGVAAVIVTDTTCSPSPDWPTSMSVGRSAGSDCEGLLSGKRESERKVNRKQLNYLQLKQQ